MSMDPTKALVNVGVDIGQMRDPTALAVTVFQGPAKTMIGHVRFIERLPLGTPYPEVNQRIQTVLFNLRNAMFAEGLVAQKFRLFMDVTGVGRPIFDMLTEQLPKHVLAAAVTLTAGNNLTKQGVEWHCPKQHVISTLNRFMTERRLILPATPTGQLTDEARQFQRELRTFVGRKESASHVETGARQGAHDDLVIAVGLSLLNTASYRPPRQRQAIVTNSTLGGQPRPVRGLRPVRGA